MSIHDCTCSTVWGYYNFLVLIEIINEMHVLAAFCGSLTEHFKVPYRWSYIFLKLFL